MLKLKCVMTLLKACSTSRERICVDAVYVTLYGIQYSNIGRTYAINDEW